MVNWSLSPAFIDPLAAAKVKLAADPGLTVTLTELLVKVPSVPLTDAASTLYSLINPPALVTPLVKVIVVEVPKAVANPFLSVTVGLKPPMVLAPLKVKVLSPVYAVAVLPYVSYAVIVN